MGQGVECALKVSSLTPGISLRRPTETSSTPVSDPGQNSTPITDPG